MDAIILAGGYGTRLKRLNEALPKPLFDIAGRPVIFRQIDALLAAGVDRITVIGGHKGDVLKSALVREFPGRLDVVIEDAPLGTGGCLAMVRSAVRGTTCVISGDIVFDVDFGKLAAFHRRAGAVLTLAVHPNNHPRDSDLVEVDGDDRVTAMLVRPHPEGLVFRNLVNASIAVCEPAVWRCVDDGRLQNFEKDVVRRLIAEGQPVYAYRTPEYIRDMGTPHRLASVTRDVETGVAAARSLRNKQRAIFLDRDGVLNVYKGFITSPSEIELEQGAAEALRRINSSPFLAIVVTNQPQLARNMIDAAGLQAIHSKLETLLGDAEAKIDAIFVCPHHPDRGFAGENAALKVDCDCRKPKPGLILQAAERFNIDIGRSFMIGDATADIALAKTLGMPGILVGTGLRGTDGKYAAVPDVVCPDLMACVDWALAHAPRVDPMGVNQPRCPRVSPPWS